MTDNDNILDEIVENTQLVLFSKLSIALTSLLISPFIGAFLYCSNLKVVGKNSILMETYISILLFFSLTTLPFYGFNSSLWGFDFIYFTPMIITVGIIIGPLWSKHFYKIDYEVKFPKKLILVLVTYLVFVVIHNIEIQSNLDPRSRPIPYSLPVAFSGFFTFQIIPLLLIYKLTYSLVFGKQKTKKANLKNNNSTEN